MSAPYAILISLLLEGRYLIPTECCFSDWCCEGWAEEIEVEQMFFWLQFSFAKGFGEVRFVYFVTKE